MFPQNEKIFFSLLLSLFCFCSICNSPAGAVPLYERTFEPSKDNFSNPERGLYSFVEYRLGETLPKLDHLKARKFSLIHLQVRLDDYRTSAIPEESLQALNRLFATLKELGLKAILRFAYNAGDGADSIAKDAALEQVLTHIDQLKPLLEDNAGLILALEAGFVGQWGEWHSSTEGLDLPEAREAVLKRLLETLPKDRNILLRTPHYKVQADFGAIGEEEAFYGFDSARIGFHNDCFLASPTDFGTYLDPIDEWKDFVSSDSRYVAVGGETCFNDEELANCGNALEELQRLKWSFMNADYHPQVIRRFEEEGCFEEIKNRLGYRFSLLWAKYSRLVKGGRIFRIEFEIENSGYAGLFNPRPLFLAFCREGERVVDFELEFNLLCLPGGATSRTEVRILLPKNMQKGKYTLAMCLPDSYRELREDPNYSIRFSNIDLPWDENSGCNLIDTEIEVIDGDTQGTHPLPDRAKLIAIRNHHSSSTLLCKRDLRHASAAFIYSSLRTFWGRDMVPYLFPEYAGRGCWRRGI